MLRKWFQEDAVHDPDKKECVKTVVSGRGKFQESGIHLVILIFTLIKEMNEYHAAKRWWEIAMKPHKESEPRFF